jgi:cation-transporting ATPase E
MLKTPEHVGTCFDRLCFYRYNDATGSGWCIMDEAIQGLTEREVIERRERGQGNDAHSESGRTYLQILRRNAFTFINCVLFAISIALILMGQWGDALVTAGLVLLNVVVGIAQEGRAKHKLEQIALLTRPTATVVREGQERTVPPTEIVLGDVLRAQPGDQIVADGKVVGPGRMEVDESLITGESERIVKRCGDAVTSGSFCITGSAHYEAQQVGGDSLVNRLTTRARSYRQVKTPLQRDIDTIVRILVILACMLGILLGISFALQGLPPVEWVRVAAVIVALVPQGLFMMTTVAYAMGALRVAGGGALIQQVNAVESMSNVDLLCLDKTGTLTTNRIRFHALQPLDNPAAGDEDRLRQILGSYAASTTAGNRTTGAILEAFGGQPCRLVGEVPFASERKWSALMFDDVSLHGTYVLGAPEVLEPSLLQGEALYPRTKPWVSQGLRVLLLAYCPEVTALGEPPSRPELPNGLIPLTLLSFSDELRPEARKTLHHFGQLGIQLRIISGDNPETVAALSRQVGFPGQARTVSGLDLAGSDESELAEVAKAATIFGRISPQQKETLVRCYRAQGHYVAMIGDGVNDVLSLKEAHVGVAMQSGSSATRDVADIVLLDDSFSALPVAFREGQRIIKGMEDVVRLLLTRTFYVFLLVVATRLVGVPFPITPRHNSILALVTVGVPILAIAAWARPGAPSRSVIRTTSHFVFPAAFTISVLALAIYVVAWGRMGDIEVARSALTTATVLCGLLLIPFVEPPTDWWVGGDELSGDWRPSALAVAMLLLYALILAVPVLREFFELVPLRAIDYLWIALAVVVWALLLRVIWRRRLFERLLEPSS